MLSVHGLSHGGGSKRRERLDQEHILNARELKRLYEGRGANGARNGNGASVCAARSDVSANMPL